MSEAEHASFCGPLREAGRQGDARLKACPLSVPTKGGAFLLSFCFPLVLFSQISPSARAGGKEKAHATVAVRRHWLAWFTWGGRQGRPWGHSGQSDREQLPKSCTICLLCSRCSQPAGKAGQSRAAACRTGNGALRLGPDPSPFPLPCFKANQAHIRSLRATHRVSPLPQRADLLFHDILLYVLASGFQAGTPNQGHIASQAQVSRPLGALREGRAESGPIPPGEKLCGRQAPDFAFSAHSHADALARVSICVSAQWWVGCTGWLELVACPNRRKLVKAFQGARKKIVSAWDCLCTCLVPWRLPGWLKG